MQKKGQILEKGFAPVENDITIVLRSQKSAINSSKHWFEADNFKPIKFCIYYYM